MNDPNGPQYDRKRLVIGTLLLIAFAAFILTGHFLLTMLLLILLLLILYVIKTALAILDGFARRRP